MAHPSPSRPELVPVDAPALPAVAEFLADKFRPGVDDHFSKLDYLRWQYLEWPPGPGPRAHSCVADGRILAHSGTLHTRFLLDGKSPSECPVASNIHSWCSTPKAGPLGALLLLQSFRTSPVQYAFSFSPQAERVFESSHFLLRQVVPMFFRALTTSRRNQCYAGQPRLKRLAFWMQEIGLARLHALRPAVRPLDLEPLSCFDGRAVTLAAAAARHSLLTERDPMVLNHLLRHPFGETRGYYLRDGRETVGLALLHFNQRHGLRQAKILDCLLASAPNAALCARALAALGREIGARDVDVVYGMAGTPWLESAYWRMGYVRRGRKPLLIRDPEQIIPGNLPAHMAYLDSDLAFLG